ncbi:hypothetical protein DPMN_053358 [Dreissena polymorpha]|uniref:Uncharacterized protein n=1 Tax=Dreissena polymorpha TaxID=45954 RepID=A0A9D4HS41_DREPO|nr:hypothetical protein DPMN_053358 [Dreissena polymorpha]
MGAIVDESQRKSVEEFAEDARKEGAEVYQATASFPARGCYYPSPSSQTSRLYPE